MISIILRITLASKQTYFVQIHSQAPVDETSVTLKNSKKHHNMATCPTDAINFTLIRRDIKGAQALYRCVRLAD